MKEKMAYIRFLSKVVTVCFGEKTRFDCKNIYGYNKSSNFRLDITSKINCKTLVVIPYTLLGLRSRKIKLFWKNFK